MAKLKLTELPAVTAKTNSDLLYVVQNGASKQISVANLLTNVIIAGEGIILESNGMVIATASPSDTNDVPENAANLYFTNARAVAAVIDNISTSNVAEGANLYFTNTRSIAAVKDNISTANVAEGANLYFTNARAVDAIVDNVSTSNVAEGANLYFTNTRAIAAVNDNIDTSNVAEGANLYFTNTRAIGSLTAGNFIDIESNGTISANINLENFSTDNLREGNNYLYHTNERVVTALTAGPGIIISANGMISVDTANVFLMDFGALEANVDGVIDYGGL